MATFEAYKQLEQRYSDLRAEVDALRARYDAMPEGSARDAAYSELERKHEQASQAYDQLLEIRREAADAPKRAAL